MRAGFRTAAAPAKSSVRPTHASVLTRRDSQSRDSSVGVLAPRMSPHKSESPRHARRACWASRAPGAAAAGLVGAAGRRRTPPRDVVHSQRPRSSAATSGSATRSRAGEPARHRPARALRAHGARLARARAADRVLALGFRRRAPDLRAEVFRARARQRRRTGRARRTRPRGRGPSTTRSCSGGRPSAMGGHVDDGGGGPVSRPTTRGVGARCASRERCDPGGELARPCACAHTKEKRARTVRVLRAGRIAHTRSGHTRARGARQPRLSFASILSLCIARSFCCLSAVSFIICARAAPGSSRSARARRERERGSACVSERELPRACIKMSKSAVASIICPSKASTLVGSLSVCRCSSR